MAERAHGTYAKYAIERCRCDDCRGAQREYNRHRVRQLSRPDGVWKPYVDADPAREHLAWLASCGIGLKSVAKLGGVAHGVLWKIVYGDRARGMAPSKRIRPATAEKILAVMPQHAAGAQKVPAGPTWRLLDELIARGWSRSELARRLGCQTPALQISRARVRAATARAVERLHAELIVIDVVPKKTRWGLRPTPVPKAPRSIKPTARVYARDARPFALAPLAAAVGLSEAAFCRLEGLHQTRACEGLTERQADELATRLGLHPFEIWPDLWAAESA